MATQDVLDVPEIVVHVDRELHDGETLGRLRVIALDGMKSPGEIALYLSDCATVILGDALWGVVSSMILLELVDFIETAFRIEVKPIDYVPENFSSVRKIINLVVRLKG